MVRWCVAKGVLESVRGSSSYAVDTLQDQKLTTSGVQKVVVARDPGGPIYQGCWSIDSVCAQ